jgi:arylsulfatase A-like enzyme
MRPNILLVLPDQLRGDWIGPAGAVPVRTPTLDALAARGLRFSNAVCPAPLCAPSRASLASGRNYYRCGVPTHDGDYPVEQATYYRHLRSAGYQVAGVGKFDLHKSTAYWGPEGTHQLEAWGFSGGVDQAGKWDLVMAADAYDHTAFDPYARYLHRMGWLGDHVADFNDRHPYFDTRPTPLPEPAYCDNWIARNALRLLHGFAPHRPWHLVVNFAGPHDPMDVTASMRERWQGADLPAPHRPDPDEDAPHRAIRQNYAAMIENIDRHLGRFLDVIQQRGELDQTLVVFSSDHGEMLGDHGLWGKKSFYHPSVHVPLVMAGPGVPDGQVSDALVSLHDLSATFLECGEAAPLPGADARSLVPLLRSPAPRPRSPDAKAGSAHRDVALSALYDGRMAFDGRYKLIERAGQSPALYDHARDPWEDRSIASEEPTIVNRLQEAVRALPGVPDEPAQPDPK